MVRAKQQELGNFGSVPGCYWFFFLRALGQGKVSVSQPALSVPWDTLVHGEPQTVIVCKTPSSSAGKCCKNWEFSAFDCSSANGPQKEADLTLLLLLTKRTCTLSPGDLQRFRGGCWAPKCTVYILLPVYYLEFVFDSWEYYEGLRLLHFSQDELCLFWL